MAELVMCHTDLSAAIGRPSPRAAHTCDTIGNFLVVFGGWSGHHALGDAFAYHVKRKRWYTLNLCLDETLIPAKKRGKFTASSLARNNHSSCIYNQELYIHGGHDGNKWLDSMFAIDISGLEDLTSGIGAGESVNVPVRYVEPNGRMPTKRACHTMVAAKDYFYSFGGFDGSQCFNDLEMFDPGTGTWTKLSKPHGKKPPARNAHVMVTDGRILYISGGHSGKDHFDDIYTYTISTHTWACIKVPDFIPPAVRGHGGCFFNGEMYIFGGYNGSEPFNVLYCYNPTRIKWRRIPVKSTAGQITRRQRNTFVTLGSEMYIFGGFNGKCWLSDLHSLKYISPDRKMADAAQATLCENLGEFVSNPLFSDVVVTASGKDIPAHRCILAASSNFFMELLQDNQEENHVIKLCGWSLEAVLKMLEHIYTAKIRDFDTYTYFRVCEIMGLADYCKLDSLKALCQESLIQRIDIENCCHLLKYSKLYNADNLRQHCFDFIGSHAADVMNTPGFEELSSIPSLVLELAKLSVK
ncbi:bifunctional BTB-POZ domain/Kelch repeat type 1/Kelch-type beta propeller/SKP1-BTB-POZ domain superfamily [Babesia duncani]|uniref:Bifunctional BTB-POZ domain/Kelch repeat type 1/Kelch-type beta propeller/SKP1-BTB-POZ domain superfamily n=1 Tax=Babesia duncani TaxID=323732 RepID=A0AAD9PPI0_9APIC|nr:bifunctional BTB-POZ domain/Kelch repeat type 1/Kelch-type beta propeller/SKP1-BTB-POZ domain superfamily [Babesia duncani]